jgi:thiol-disulfide isomerase/thioredoxin
MINMKIILLSALLIAAEVSNGQTPDIYRYPQIQEHKTNFFIDTLTRKLFNIRSIDSSIRAGTGVGLPRDSVVHDTAFHLFYFIKPFKETDFYKKRMGQPFPPFSLIDLNNERISNNGNKIILLNFWSTTCGPCIAEMPYLNRLVDSLQSDSFECIAITPDKEAKVRQFLRRHPFRYKVVTDASCFTDRIRVRNYPTNIIIDTTGKVISIIEGVEVDRVTRKPLIRQEIDSVLRSSF